MIKYLSLFSGIGAPEQALKNIGIDYDLVGFSEVDKYAIQSYCAVHDADIILDHLGDITKIDIDSLPANEIDLITHGSPCQDFSVAGNNKGGDEGSGTRSSLMWNTVKIVERCKPKYVLWENVKNVLSKKHKHNFDKYINEMNRIGYNNYYKVLNSQNYGVPQNRDRVFTISIRKDVNKNFEFPQGHKSEIKLKDILEDNVDESYYKFTDRALSIIDEIYIKGAIYFRVKEATKKGYALASEGDSINMNYPGSASKRGRVGKNSCHTLSTQCEFSVIQNDKMRMLTPLECWRLMGFKDEQFYKAAKVCSNSQLYKQAGNSIVVNVLEEIFKNLFK